MKRFFLLLPVLALLGWLGYEYNDMRHHLGKIHDGMTYAEVRKALPYFLIKEELNPCRQHSQYDFWMTLSTPGRLHFLYFDRDLILRTPPAEPATSESHAESAEDAETIDIPFYYEWANPGTPEEMRKALEPVQRTIDGLERLVSSSCRINPSGRADYTVVFSTTGDAETNARETIRILYEALDHVPVPDGAVLRVPVLVKGVKTPGAPTTPSPAETETHAENAESAEN